MKLSKEQFYIYSERVCIMMEDPEMDEATARKQALREALGWDEPKD